MGKGDTDCSEAALKGDEEKEEGRHRCHLHNALLSYANKLQQRVLPRRLDRQTCFLFRRFSSCSRFIVPIRLPGAKAYPFEGWRPRKEGGGASGCCRSKRGLEKNDIQRTDERGERFLGTNVFDLTPSRWI